MSEPAENLWSLLGETRVRGALTAGAPGWSLEQVRGRLVEVCGRHGRGRLSAAALMAHACQADGDIAAWVSAREDGGVVYPPDLAFNGIDLRSMPFVTVRGAVSAAKAADLLLRSGGYGLVILDLGRGARLPPAAPGRLVKLAQRHHGAVVCITDTEPDEPSLGSMVSLRVAASLRRVEGGRMELRVAAVKDKQRGPGWSASRSFRVPSGVR